jgi:hypothetical protein
MCYNIASFRGFFYLLFFLKKNVSVCFVLVLSRLHRHKPGLICRIAYLYMGKRQTCCTFSTSSILLFYAREP